MTIHFTLVEPDSALERAMAEDVDTFMGDLLKNKCGPFPTLLEDFFSDTETFEMWVFDAFGDTSGKPLSDLMEHMAFVRDCKAAMMMRGAPSSDLDRAHKELGKAFYNLITDYMVERSLEAE